MSDLDSTSAPKPRIPLWQKLLASKFLLVSIIVHLLFGAGATYFVVQQIQAKRKMTFSGGPPATNASTRAIEHKVSMAKKKNTMSAPAQAKRITTTGLAKVSLPDMPTISAVTDVTPGKMAGMGGTGIGLGPGGGGMGGGMGGGGGSIPFFGFRGKKGSGVEALTGYLYDLKQSADNKPTGMTPGKYGEIVKEFINKGWSEQVFASYFKAPKPLYTTQFFIPDMAAEEGPKAFDLDRGPNKVEPKMWVIHYKGRATAPATGKFRFVGFADDILEVRFGGDVVLSAGCNGVGNAPRDEKYVYKYLEGGRQDFYQGFGSIKGKTISVEVGKQYEMEVLLGEQPGGFFCAHLLIEQEGATYEKDKETGHPVLPIFQLMAGRSSKAKAAVPPFAPGLVWSRAGANKPASIFKSLAPP
ncbi:MAG TPA: hypothetical protein VF614_00695 [Chthoniobacteraceae bacterium]|jgi:hypothetical protein